MVWQDVAVGAPNYSSALDGLPDASPAVVEALLRRAAEPLGAREVSAYLADVQHVVLQPLLLSPDLSDPILAEEAVSSSLAGQVFLTGEPAIADRGDGTKRVWVPLIERGERTGVLALTLASLDDAVLADCVRLGLFAGLLVRGFTPVTDLFALRRRRRTMTLAAGMQWDLLPPLTVRCAQASGCGRLEPAYEIAGDAFDYALNNRHLEAGIFDGMGHGVASTLLTTLAVGAYRHARRLGDSPSVVASAIDQAVSDHYEGEAFVTAILVRLGLDSGVVEWTNAGHPAPLLMRGGRVVGELPDGRGLPLGLTTDHPRPEPHRSAIEQLEPGDRLLLYTDGVIEGRSADGDHFGVDRLMDLWERHASAGVSAEQTLRELAQAVMDFGAGKIRDDATLLQLYWHGPQPA